jgi:CheY-like chemotaxis protein
MICRPRLLLAEDDLDTGNLLRTLLQPEFEVIAHVRDGETLVTAAAQLAPDVIVSDIMMPGLDGIMATTAILQSTPAMPIILVTGYGDPAVAEKGLAAGALGCVWKVAAGDELIPAVHGALHGERHVSAALQCPDGIGLK